MTLKFSIEFQACGKLLERIGLGNDVTAEIAGIMASRVIEEREACAKVAQEYGDHFDQIASGYDDYEMGQAKAGKNIAALIRERR